jgi:uncharacterized protein (DUF58 family)
MLGRNIWGRLSMRQLLRIRDFVRNGRTAPDLNLTQRRPLYIIALLLLLTSLFTQYALLFICGLLLLGIAIVPELWYRFGLRGLVVTREMESGRVGFGQMMTVPLMVENRKLLPLPMVETIDEFPEALTVLGARLGLSTRPGSALLARGLRLWTYQRVRRRYYVRAIQRGAYNVGPTLVRVTDPFGILTREETYETRRALLVHPLIAPLERFDLTPRAIFGDHASRLRLLEDPLRVAGIREYAPGDDPRRVHWKATARMGVLQSKLLDPSTQRTLLIALDVRTFNRAQLGYDPDLAELGIAVAASVAAWATERSFAVGLIANGAISNITPETDGRPPLPQAAPSGAALALPRLRLEPAARPEQLTLILDSLARVMLFGGTSMGPLLTEEMRSAPTGATLVYVGLESLVDVGTMIALRRIQATGHAVSLVLTARDNDDPFIVADEAHNLHAAGLPIHYVGGRLRWRGLVAEALDGLPPRRATDAPNEEHLDIERRLIARQRQARADWRERRKSEESHAEPEQQRRDEDDDGQPDAPHPPALALP